MTIGEGARLAAGVGFRSGESSKVRSMKIGVCFLLRRDVTVFLGVRRNGAEGDSKTGLRGNLGSEEGPGTGTLIEAADGYSKLFSEVKPRRTDGYARRNNVGGKGGSCDGA